MRHDDKSIWWDYQRPSGFGLTWRRRDSLLSLILPVVHWRRKPPVVKEEQHHLCLM